LFLTKNKHSGRLSSSSNIQLVDELKPEQMITVDSLKALLLYLSDLSLRHTTILKTTQSKQDEAQGLFNQVWSIQNHEDLVYGTCGHQNMVKNKGRKWEKIKKKIK